MRVPFKYKLAGIILVILVPLSAFSVHHYFEMLRRDRQDAIYHNLEIVKNVAATLDQLLSESLLMLEVLSMHPSVISKASEKCDTLFAGLLQAQTVSLNIIAAGMDGYNYGSGISTPEVRRLNYRDMEWFRMASRGRPAIGNIHVSKLFKRPTIMIARPVFDGKTQVGVIGAPLDLTKMQDAFSKAWRLPHESQIIIVDSKGNILIDTLDRESIGKNIMGLPLVKKALESREGTAEDAGMDNIRRLYSFISPDKADWRVILGVPAEHVALHALAFSMNYVIMLVIVGLSAFLLALLLAKGLAGNVSSLLAGIKEIERGNLNVKINLSGNDEFNTLAESFNQMTEVRKQAVSAMRLSEEKYHSMMKNASDGILLLDTEGHVLEINDKLKEITGYNEEEVFGAHFALFIPKAALDQTAAAFKDTLQKGRGYLIDGSALGKDGRIIPVDITGSVIEYAGKRAVQAIVRDNTERKQAENELQTSEAKFHSIIEGIGEGVIVIDRDFKIILANKGYCNQMKIGCEEIIGRPCYEVSHHFSKPCFEMGEECSVKSTFETGSSHRVIHTHFDKDNHPVYIETISYPMKDPSGKITSAIEVLTDVSHRIELENEVKDRIKELEEFYDMAVGRELRMAELKNHIDRLEGELRKQKSI